MTCETWQAPLISAQANLFVFAGVVELVDTQDLKSCSCIGVPVQFRPPAPKLNTNLGNRRMNKFEGMYTEKIELIFRPSSWCAEQSKFSIKTIHDLLSFLRNCN